MGHTGSTGLLWISVANYSSIEWSENTVVKLGCQYWYLFYLFLSQVYLIYPTIIFANFWTHRELCVCVRARACGVRLPVRPSVGNVTTFNFVFHFFKNGHIKPVKLCIATVRREASDSSCGTEYTGGTLGHVHCKSQFSALYNVSNQIFTTCRVCRKECGCVYWQFFFGLDFCSYILL
jgi:hypothetical protein